MPNSLADESYNVWKSFAPGQSIANCEYAFLGGTGSLTNARDTVYPGSGSIAEQARNYWKSRAEALGLVAGTQLSVTDYMLYAQSRGG